MAGVTEIAMSFDTTGSMKHCLNQVRDNLDSNIARVLKEHPNTRIALIAHGDYWDADETYTIMQKDFTNKSKDLCDFVHTVRATHGGDTDECYELVLRKVRTELSWTPGSKRAYVLIGDCGPHPPDFPDNILHVDWKQEVKELAKMGVRGYSVHCHPAGKYQEMYSTLSTQTRGVYLKLSDLANISDTLVAICKHRHNPDLLPGYEDEVTSRNAHMDMKEVFAALRLHADGK